MKLTSYANYALRALQLTALKGICFPSRKMQEATAAFMAVLDDLTIAQIAANPGQLMERIAPLEMPRPETPAR